jgi:HAE1 family hydrophobic/amphiphilic exporter-1
VLGDVQIFGERKYSMRLWLDPNRLASRGLTPQDVVNALREQNLQVGAGGIGQQPAPEGQMYQIDLRASADSLMPPNLRNCPKTDDQMARLSSLKMSVGLNLGQKITARSCDFGVMMLWVWGLINFLAVTPWMLPVQSKQKCKRLAKTFPPGLKYQVAFDTTLYVETVPERGGQDAV